MNKFSADFSSSAPSTPGTPPARKNRGLFADFGEHPSTTPAGAPPSSAASFTPAGLPPSSAFGSSQFGSGVSKLQLTSNSEAAKQSLRFAPSTDELPPRTKNGTPARPKNRSVRSVSSRLTGPKDTLGSLPEDEDEEDYGDSMEEEEDEENDEPGSPAFTGFTGINAGQVPRSYRSQTAGRRSVASKLQRSVQANRNTSLSHLPRSGNPDAVPGIIRDTNSRARPASITEADHIVIATEVAVRDLYDESRAQAGQQSSLDLSTKCAHQLIELWRSESTRGQPSQAGLSSQFAKANYLASLLLALYHPPSKAEVAATQFSTSRSLVPASSEPVSLPQILLDWLDTFHTSYDPLRKTVESTQPNCTAHALYWDLIHSLVLRAKLREVVALLADSDFKYASSALDDGSQKPGYTGAQLQAVQSIMYRARHILDACPGTKHANWNVGDSEWDLYRRRVLSELEYLTTFVDGDGQDDDSFHAENFGIRKSGPASLGRSLRRTTNNFPLTVYENMKTVYKIILGNAEEIMTRSQDWLECTTSLTIWWDGTGDDSVAAWTMNVSRSYGAILAENPFLSRLRAAFLYVTDPNGPDSFPINNTSRTELGIGAIFQGDLEGALMVMQSFSLCVTSALAELGSVAGWLSASSGVASGLNQDDLMVLSYGGGSKDFNKDEILSGYAEVLFEKDHFVESSGVIVEGWEVALEILSRLTDPDVAKTMTAEFLDGLQLQDQARMDKVVSSCAALGLEEEGRKVSERFADHLVNTSSKYGLALAYYARSHASKKIRQVIDLLNSYCLVQSQAYPNDDEMDEELKAMVESPKLVFQELGKFDSEAAEMLRFYFAGYACLRKFYGLRDEEVVAAKSIGKPAHRPLARRRMATKALIAAINSAADSIYGGLYDAERHSAIQVDGLLPLLGEATALLVKSEDGRLLTSQQMYGLLAAIEDLESVSTRVYDASEECLQAALRNFHGSLPPSPHAMLKKSVSSGTNSNFSFSMMGSEMLARSGESSGGKSLGSMVLVGDGAKGRNERGWDWRSQFKTKGTTGADVLKFLRVSIAKDMALSELEGSAE